VLGFRVSVATTREAAELSRLEVLWALTEQVVMCHLRQRLGLTCKEGMELNMAAAAAADIMEAAVELRAQQMVVLAVVDPPTQQTLHSPLFLEKTQLEGQMQHLELAIRITRAVLRRAAAGMASLSLLDQLQQRFPLFLVLQPWAGMQYLEPQVIIGFSTDQPHPITTESPIHRGPIQVRAHQRRLQGLQQDTTGISLWHHLIARTALRLYP